MLIALLRPCLCLALGEILMLTAGVPVAGSVLGLCLFALLLVRTGGACRDTRAVVDAVMPHYGMLYVPAGVGILVHAASLPARVIPLLAGIVIGTVVTVAVTGLVTESLTRALGLAEEPESDAAVALTAARS